MDLVSGRHMATEIELSAWVRGALTLAKHPGIPQDIRELAEAFEREGMLVDAFCCYLVGQQTSTPMAPSRELSAVDRMVLLRLLTEEYHPWAERVFGEHDDGVLDQFLGNGARLYVDHSHPEYAAPLCHGPRQAALYERAGTFEMEDRWQVVDALLGDGSKVWVHRNLADRKGNSWGYHENFLLKRQRRLLRLLYERGWPTFLVSSVPLWGAGGPALLWHGAWSYVISPRAEHIEKVVSNTTTTQRALINTRDEPHADRERWFRLHVICSDANASEFQTMVKLGSKGLALNFMLAPDGVELPQLEDPIRALRRINQDPTLTERVRLSGGRSITALDLNEVYYEAVCEHANRELDLLPDEAWVLQQWGQILVDLRRDVASCADRLDWVAKQQISDRVRDRDGLSWEDDKLWQVHLDFDDVARERSIARKLEQKGMMRRVFDDSAIDAARREPPSATMAYVVGNAVTRFGSEILPAWDELIHVKLDSESGLYRYYRVELDDPTAWTRDEVESIVRSADSPKALIEALNRHAGGQK